jgi:hypothetical protein
MFPLPVPYRVDGKRKRETPAPHCVHSSPLFTPSVRDIGTALPDAGLRPLHLINVLDGDPVKRTQALLGSNPPRISRCKRTAMRGGPVCVSISALLPLPGVTPVLPIAVDLPMP